MKFLNQFTSVLVFMFTGTYVLIIGFIGGLGRFLLVQALPGGPGSRPCSTARRAEQCLDLWHSQ